MKLYKTYRRLGTRITTLRKPTIAPDTSPEFEVGLSSCWPEFWQWDLRWADGTPITYDEQYRLIVHFVKRAVFTHGLEGALLVTYVRDKIFLLRYAVMWKVVAGVVIVVGVLYLACWLFLPDIEDVRWEDDYGTKWLMRYEGRVWWAKWTGSFDYDMPIFEQLQEAGNIIVSEGRNPMSSVGRPDIWYHLDAWTELKGAHLSWLHDIWSVSYNRYCGMMVQVERGFYGLQKSYHKFMPPVTDWT